MTSEHRNSAQRTLGGVVAEADAAVIEKAGEPVPVVEAIADVFGDRRLGGDARELLLKPDFERQHQRLAFFLSHRAALSGAAAPDRLLDRIEGRDARESLAGDRSGTALGDVEEAASQMPAACTVSKYLNRTRRAGLTWPLPPELDDDVRLENRLYPPPSDLPSEERPQPDWATVHRELRRPGVTLMLLWEEYCDTTSDGFSYSWFCERYKEWAGRLKLSLRQVHVAGEKLFVDYSGHTMEVIDGLTGEVLTAQIFVAVLGASNYTYAEATLRMTMLGDARFTRSTIEVFHNGKRIASQLRSRVAHKHTTLAEHMSSSHRRYAEWSPARLSREAEQGFRSCLGILSLVKSYEPQRVEAAARRGNDIGATTYGSINSILNNGLDRDFAKPTLPDASPIRHADIRGRGYYH